MSKAIVNAASDITYRPLIEADDTGRCTLISFTWSSFSNKTVTISLDRQQKNVLNVIPFRFFFNNTIIVQVKYSTIATKEAARIGYNVFFSPHE